MVKNKRVGAWRGDSVVEGRLRLCISSSKCQAERSVRSYNLSSEGVETGGLLPASLA